MWLALALLAAAIAGAQGLGVGERIEAFSLTDQHDEERSVDTDTAVILFSRDMAGGEILEAALAGVGADTLGERRIVYVADISGMPRLIGKMFAIPSMRKHPYAILLDRDGSKTAQLPDEEGGATLIFCDALQITRIAHLDTASGVREALGLPAQP